MKKIALLSVVALASTLSLASCKKSSSGGDNVDSSKAQLTILTYDGGVGDQWLKNAAQIFELENQERTDFEDGKTGVQVHITKQRIGGDSLLNTDLTFDMYFTENINYYAMINNNKMADITDILTTANPKDDNKKIIDKVDDNLREFMNKSGKYYAVPFYDCIYGFFYDKDLFDDKLFYMTDAGGWTNDRSEFGTGPNGVAGDWDDGLPKTYAQFKKLLERMVLKGVTPFTYSSNAQMSYYTARALMSYWSDDEGFDEANLNYSFNGTAHNIIKVQDENAETLVPKFDGDKPETEEVAITEANGYLLKRQAGVYNALNFAKNYLCFTPSNYKPSSSVATAQVNFVCGKIQEEPVGMIVEGTWWENEAVNAFNLAKSMGANSFNYGIMPIPKSSDDKVGEDATFLNLNESYGFIASNTSHMKLAKEFFSFLHTDSQLKAFTTETGMTRALDYSLTEAEAQNVSSFTRDLISIKQSEHARLLYPCSGKNFFIDNSYIFNSTTWLWSTVDLGENPVVKFIATPSLSAQDYFAQHINVISASKWSDIIG